MWFLCNPEVANPGKPTNLDECIQYCDLQRIYVHVYTYMYIYYIYMYIDN